MNIEQMTQKTREALQSAQRIAVEYSNNAVEGSICWPPLPSSRTGLSRSCCRPSALTPMPLPRRPCRRSRRCSRVTGSSRDPEKIYISNDLDRALNAAEQQAKQMKDEYISVEHVFLGHFAAAGQGCQRNLQDFRHHNRKIYEAAEYGAWQSEGHE